MDELKKALDEIKSDAATPLPMFGRTALSLRLQEDLQLTLTLVAVMQAKLDLIATYRKTRHALDRQAGVRPRLFNAGDVPILENHAADTLKGLNDAARRFLEGKL